LSKTPLEIVRAADGRQVVDEDGNVETIRLLPGLSDEELRRLEAMIPCPIPTDVRDLLSYTRGFEGSPIESVDFGGFFEPIFEELFPCALPIAHDGYGNYWVVDLISTTTEWGPILYVCHDPPVIVYQCADLATFIEDVLRLAEPPYDGPIDAVHEEHSMRIWRENPGAVPRDEVLVSTDESIRRFAEQLTSEHYVVDLRRATIGDGFSWGRFGPKTAVSRAGEERVFAYQRRSSASRLRKFFRGR
jgi:hypothetical protein